MKNYRISSKAISDLENIWLFTFNTWSKEQADRYHQLIIKEIEFIVVNHELCRKVDHIKKAYQVSQVKSHLIFFKIAKDQFIEIIRILHKNMDVENQV